MGSASLPLSDDIISVGGELRSAPEVKVRKRCTEVRGERFDGGSTAQRLVQGVLEADVGSGEFVDDAGFPRVTPELGEPAADDGLIVVL